MKFDIHIVKTGEIDGAPCYQGEAYGASGKLASRFANPYPSQIEALKNALAIVAHFCVADGDEIVGDGLQTEIGIYFGPRLEGMQELGDRNYALISRGAKACGSYDPAEILVFFEEQLYTTEAKEITAFLQWCHDNDLTFGHGNYEQRFAEFKAAS